MEMKTKDDLMHDQLYRLYDQQAKLLCQNNYSSKIMLKVVNRQIQKIETYFEKEKD